MKITFLGTGAADWPIIKDKSAVEYRRYSCVLIDDVLLIDPGPQAIEALLDNNINPERIKYIINTHKHSDHFCEETVKKLEAMNAVFYEFSYNESKKIGNYTINSYKGNHSTCNKTVHYIIKNGNDTLFYGLDGAWLLYEEYEAIKNFKPDLVVIDATIGFIDGDYRIFEHNNLKMVSEIKKSIDPYIKKFCISHMSKTLHTNHFELCKKMKKQNIIVAYDGMTLRF